MKSKGFTLIELLAVIVILAVIALIATPIILGLISDSKKQAFMNSTYGIAEAAKNNYIETMYSSGTPVDVVFTYEDGEETSSVAGKVLKYEGEKPQNGTVSLTSNGSVAIALHNGTLCAYKSFSDSEVTVEEKSLADCNSEYSDTKGVNVPKLTQGMTPIKWDGSKWIETDAGDSNWYSYDTTNKNWANAKTADGSMWVWIPRYIYKIATNHHVNTTGTVEVQFSKGIKDDWNDSITLNTNTTADASNNTWTNHPGFTFGSTELTGIWVAKFEPTAVEGVKNGYDTGGLCPIVGDNDPSRTIKIVPNIASWRCISTGNAFTASRNMETKAAYGWNVASTLQADGTFTTDANNIDTHLMKSIEWGVVSYLSKSQYGKNAEEIYINNNQNFITGCAGNTVSAVAYDGCQNSYETVGGVKASTTGNIYGIYDMAGGAWEKVSAYMNNGNANLSGNGASIINADSKYKDIYTVTTDVPLTNYNNTADKKGEAIWETSNGSSGSASWFGDNSNIPITISPWFLRGGSFTTGVPTGVFAFGSSSGITYNYNGFRPVLVVAPGL